MSSLMFVRPAVSEELRHTDRFAVRLAGCADVARRAVISNVGLKISFQQAKPVSLIERLFEQTP